MALADALARQNTVNTSLNNTDTAICPEPVIINTLDLALARHIQTSSLSDPLVIQAIKSLQEGSPLFPCSTVKDWTFKGGHLYYKGRMYIPPTAQHTLVTSLHNSWPCRPVLHQNFPRKRLLVAWVIHICKQIY